MGRGTGNNWWSITDAITAGGAIASGNPLGAAAVGANIIRRNYGNQIAAHVLDTATRMESVQRAKKVTDEDIRALREATRNPEAITARVADAVGDLPKYAPKTAREISLTVARAAAWAQATLPKEQPPIGPQFTQKAPRPLTDEQRIRATAIIETIEDGSVVIDRLRDGSLSAEHVATLKYVHPEIYARIQADIAKHATELHKELTTQQEFRLALLFGTPISEAQLPENVRALQASFSQGNQAPGMGGAGGNTGPAAMSAGPVNVGESSATGPDKLESGTT